MLEQTGKELVPTSDGSVTKAPSKPSLVLVGSRYISSDGRWHSDLLANYVSDHGRHKWLPVGELSRVVTGGNTITGKKRVRKNTAALFNEHLKRGDFLLYHSGPNGRTDAVKLLDITSEAERQQAIPQLERMKQRRQLSSDKYETALKVIELNERVQVAQ